MKQGNGNTHLHRASPLPGSGGPHAILRPLQKRQASAGFFLDRLDCVASEGLAADLSQELSSFLGTEAGRVGDSSGEPIGNRCSPVAVVSIGEVLNPKEERASGSVCLVECGS
jgi:hypothetical protein